MLSKSDSNILVRGWFVILMQGSVPIGIKKNYQLELSFAKKGIFVTVLVRSISFYCFENDYIQ